MLWLNFSGAVIANKKEKENFEKVTVAGRFCESGDILINPISHVSLSNLEIIELFLLSILNLSLSDAFVITSRFTRLIQA